MRRVSYPSKIRFHTAQWGTRSRADGDKSILIRKVAADAAVEVTNGTYMSAS